MRTDVEQTIEKLRTITSKSKKYIEIAEAMLNDDETVLLVVPTNSKRLRRNFVSQVLFLTDKRIFVNRRVLIKFTSESTPLDEIIYVHFTSDNSTHGYIEIKSSTKIYSISLTGKLYMLKQVYQEFETAINNYKAQQAAQNNAPQPDIVDQIEKLAQLRDKGIITEEEFQAKKTDLLSRM